MPDLIDTFGRRIEYLRLSVTDRCNYRCFYCLPAEGLSYTNRADFLGYEELTRLVRLFSELGVHKVRLTGGEPLVRRDLARLATMISCLPRISDLSLSTNGHLLERFAIALKRAGIDRINISLDSLDKNIFTQITGGGDLATVIRGIHAARDAGMHPIKINMVVMQGINDDEIETMFDFACQYQLDLRFIETMPVGSAGINSMTKFYPASQILERVRETFGNDLVPLKGTTGAGPARYYLVNGGPMKFGVISAISRHFCKSCNRVRLTAKGDLVLCLGKSDRTSLSEYLQTNCTDDVIKQAIIATIARKPERHHFMIDDDQDRLNMSLLGG